MKVLIVDDDRDVRDIIGGFLEFDPELEGVFAENGYSAQRILQEQVVEAVIVDLNMPGMNGLELLKWIQQEGPAIPAIMMSGFGSIHDAVEAMKLGAQDYVVKPVNPEELLIRIKRLIGNQNLKDQMEIGKRGQLDEQGWIGDSPKMVAIKRLVKKVAATPSTVLITGESGTGKEVIAKAIHALSPRSSKPFIAINIGGIPETLLESELFGYERGAFTGANARKIGMFEIAAGGTLFLDEIGETPIHLQVKLLRVLQDLKIQRLGGTQTIPVDARIIAATNRNLQKQVKDGKFREDLFYRLNVIQLKLPPLRERKDDIPKLIGHFLKKYNRVMGKAIQGLDPESLRVLQNYAFPGNVRELENMIERMVILADSDTIVAKDLALPMEARPPIKTHQGTLADVEKELVIATLRRWEGNRTHASKELGITRRTLLNKIKEFGIEET